MSVFISETQQRSNPYLNRVHVVQGSIVDQDTDAIVTLIPQNLEYVGVINEKIKAIAGDGIVDFVAENVIAPRVGDIYAVPGFNLPCKHIYFCVVPSWKDEWSRHDRQLLNATRQSMELAARMSLKSIAFPPIGSGKKAFPKARAARLIIQGIKDRLDESFDEVRIACQTEETKKTFEEKLFAS